MEIKAYYSLADKEHWLQEIQKSDWRAGRWLYELLRGEKLKALCGQRTEVYLLTDGRRLAAFCTLAEVDDVRDTGLGPWVGFVYTFPAYRGHRYMGLLLQHAQAAAKSSGASRVYISTGETGLYEKYGYAFYGMMKDHNGEDSRVYSIEV